MNDKLEWYYNGHAFLLPTPSGMELGWRGFVWNPKVGVFEPTAPHALRSAAAAEVDLIIFELVRREVYAADEVGL